MHSLLITKFDKVWSSRYLMNQNKAKQSSQPSIKPTFKVKAVTELMNPPAAFDRSMALN